MDKSLVNTGTGETGGQLVIPNIETFKSIYYMLNANPDSKLKIIREDRIINLDSLNELHSKILDKCSNHEIVVEHVTINVILSAGNALSFSGWSNFTDYDYHIAEITKSIDIKWDLYFKLPNYDMPQRHTLQIRIGSNLRPGEYYELLHSGASDIEIARGHASLICSVNFINSIIANELISIVSSWYETRPKCTCGFQPFVFIEKMSEVIYQLIHWTIFASFLLAFAIRTKAWVLQKFSEDFSQSLYFFVLFTLFYAFITNDLSKRIAMYSRHKLVRLKERAMFKLTDGDQNKVDEDNKKNWKILRDVFVNIAASLLLALMTYFLSSFVNFLKVSN